MSYIKLSLVIFSVIAVTRFVPHPPNFTSLIALSYYTPALLGFRFIPIALISFAFTDIFFGYHNTLFFTWGSVVLIGFLGLYLKSSPLKRIAGTLISAVVFFVITNLGVWLSGLYSSDLSGLIVTYLLAIPFFANNVVSALLFSLAIEFGLLIYKSYRQKLNLT